jgi:hypothetical protein
MDEWINRNRIEMVKWIFLKYYIIILFKTDEFIIEEPLLKKKNKKGEEKRTDFVENDEHEGMDY